MKNSHTFAHGLIREVNLISLNSLVISFSVINYVVSMRFPAGCGEPYLFYATAAKPRPPYPHTGHGGQYGSFSVQVRNCVMQSVYLWLQNSVIHQVI